MTSDLHGRPVVVGVEPVAQSRDAAIIGTRIATAAAAPLHFVTAIPDVLLDTVAARARVDPREFDAARLRGAISAVGEQLRGVVDPARLEQILEARIGRPEHVLAEFTRQVGAGITVIGGKRRAVVSAWFRRGTAHHLARCTETPVFVTGPHSDRIERVLVALDISHAAAPTIHVARQLAALLDAHVEVVHVADSDRPIDAGGISGAFSLARDAGHTADAVERAEQRAEAEIWPLLEPAEKRRVVGGRPARTIARLARKGPPTVLVMGSHGRGWVDRLLLGSTTEALLSELPASVVVVPALPVGARA